MAKSVLSALIGIAVEEGDIDSEGQASALDTRDFGEGREVGNARVREADGRDMAHDITFAFAFHAFHPEGRWMLGDSTG